MVASWNISFFLRLVEESRTKELPSLSITYLLHIFILWQGNFFFCSVFSVLIYPIMELSFLSSMHHCHSPVNKSTIIKNEAWWNKIVIMSVHPSFHLISLCVLTRAEYEDLCYSFFCPTLCNTWQPSTWSNYCSRETTWYSSREAGGVYSCGMEVITKIGWR